MPKRITPINKATTVVIVKSDFQNLSKSSFSSASFKDMGNEAIEDDDDDDGPEIVGGPRFHRLLSPFTAKSAAAGTFSSKLTRAAEMSNSVTTKVAGLPGKLVIASNFASSHAIAGATQISAASAAMAPAAVVLGPIGLGLSLLSSAMSVWSASKTYQHMANLQQIVDLQASLARSGTVEAIAYTLKKKNKKLKKKGLGAIPIAGSVTLMVYGMGKYIYKRGTGSLGVSRKKYAKDLWTNYLVYNDPCAQAAIRELLGDEIFNLIKNCGDGDTVLAEKLKSL